MSKYISRNMGISFVTLLVVSLVAGFGMFPKLQGSFNDNFLKKGATASPDIIIIKIDNASIEALGRYPWSRSVHADLINTISLGEPAVIGLDLTFTEESANAENDKMLSEAIKNAGNVVLPIDAKINKYLNDKSEYVAISKSMPLEEFEKYAVALGHINTLTDEYDAFVRRHIPYIYDEENNSYIDSFALTLYNQYKNKVQEGFKPISLDSNAFNKPFIYYTDISSSVLEYPKIQTLSYIDALDPETIDPEIYRDKIILVGVYGSGLSDDVYYTPTSGVVPMHGVEIHANIINNLIYKEYKLPIQNSVSIVKTVFDDIVPFYKFNFIMVLVLGAISLFILSKTKTLVMKISFIILFFIFDIAIYYLILEYFGYIVEIIYPLITLITLFLINVIDGYIQELRKRKHITTVFGRYMAPEVVGKVIAEGEESLRLGGVKRNISVLFADIRGFTTMSEKLEAENVVNILNKLLGVVTDKIFDNQGVLDKYIGDAAMALFNVPYDLENHALHAVKTAVQVRDANKELYEELVKEFGQGVMFGIGVNTGEAIVGNIGSKGRMDYTAIGDTVNISARLQANAKAGQILISSDTYELVKEYVNVIEIGNLTVKGRISTILTYEVIDIIK